MAPRPAKEIESPQTSPRDKREQKVAPLSPAEAKWMEENAAAMRAWGDWVEANGVPLKPLF